MKKKLHDFKKIFLLLFHVFWLQGLMGGGLLAHSLNLVEHDKNASNLNENEEHLPLQAITVRGKVSSEESNEGIPGVNIILLGTSASVGTVTDINGYYVISVPSESAVLVFSFIGYKTQEIAVGGQSVINVALETDVEALDEVVVIGYGSVEKRDLTGSVSSIGSREIARVPVISLDQALQGRASGVFVSNNNANPGGEVNIRIRGTNSIQGNNEPLYVLDGFIGGNINTINPSDIKSIEVLKDASATSIYGSRGANGVVIVTTKRGIKGQTNINFDMFQGFQTRSRKIDLMGARDYANFVNALDEDNGVAPTFPDVDNLPNNTDWQDMIYRTGHWQNYSLSASGGSENINFYVSGAYIDQQGIMKETGYDRFNVRANIDAKISNNINVGARIGYSRIDRTVQSGEELRNVDSDVGPLVWRSLGLQPTEPAYDEEGNLLPLIEEWSNLPRAVPLFELQNVHRKRYDNSINGNFFAEIQLLKSLKFRSTYGFDISNIKQNRYNPSTVWTTGGGFQNSASVNTTSDIGWLNENYLSFDQNIGNHKLQLVGGMTLQGFDRETFGVGVSNFAIDDFLYHNIAAGANIGSYNTDMSQWRQASFFGRAQYNHNEKYLFTFNGRYDGNSKFGAANKWGFFPSGAFAWRLSEEDFIQQTGLFRDLKLRASYGVSGSEALGPYRSLAVFDARNPAVIIGNEWAVGFVPTRLPNPDLKWETTTQLDVGLDFSILDGRLGFVLDYFNKVTNDLFLNKPVPATTGLNTVQANIGSLRNSGFELGIDAVVSTGEFFWDVNLNGTFQNSEIISLGDVDELIFNLGSHSMSVMRVGQPLGTFFGYQTDGIWGTDDEGIGDKTQFGVPVEPGDVKLIDQNEDGDVNPDDRVILGNSQPRFFGGINNYFTFKGFDLSIFMQYVSGNSIFNRTAATGYYDPQSYSNKHVDFNNAWRPDNQDTAVPRVGAYLPTDMYDIFLENGAFLRMREVTLGYTLPSSVLERVGISRLRVYASGTNLFTLTNYTGYDPEVNYVGGSVTVLNMDNGSYPRARTLLLGLNLTF
jgi:TonB-linked SusC/RagA family outer membrane protein